MTKQKNTEKLEEGIDIIRNSYNIEGDMLVITDGALGGSFTLSVDGEEVFLEYTDAYGPFDVDIDNHDEYVNDFVKSVIDGDMYVYEKKEKTN